MKLYPYVLMVFAHLTTNVCVAQCHHSGGHSFHSSGHSYSHGHSFHSAHHYHSRDGYQDGIRPRAQALADPRKGINEVAANPGVVSGMQLADGNKIKYATPVYTGAYRYYVSNGLAIGVAVAAQQMEGIDTCRCLVQPGKSYSLYDYRISAVTVAASMSVVLFTGASYQSYMGLDIGMTIINESDKYFDNSTSALTDYRLNAQLTLLGFRVGHALGGFFELGIGYKGLVCMGVSYHAGWHKAHLGY